MSEKAKKPAKKNDAKLQEQITELTHDLQRLQAEFINYKRREEDAKAEIANYATEKVVTELLPLFDNLERALGHRPEELKGNSWADGVEQIGGQVAQAMQVLGVEKIPTVGEQFDHNLHEAVQMEDGDGQHEVVTEELQAGYRIGDRIIRHAIVKVGRK
jgi:molecular chaperone GrpE